MGQAAIESNCGFQNPDISSGETQKAITYAFVLRRAPHMKSDPLRGERRSNSEKNSTKGPILGGSYHRQMRGPDVFGRFGACGPQP